MTRQQERCNGSCETVAGCDCITPCCTGRCNQGRQCVAYTQAALPRVVPCSTVARWFMAWRRFWLG